jgi:hypothetical protein
MDTDESLFSARRVLLALSVIFFFAFFMFFAQSVRSNRIDREDAIYQDYEHALAGKHELRKFRVDKQIETHANGNYESHYFLFINSSEGSYQSVTREFSHVRFYYRNCYDEFQFMEIDISKVIVCDDHVGIEPYVEFVDYNNRQEKTDNLRNLYNDVTWVKIHCNKGEFGHDINIDELK